MREEGLTRIEASTAAEEQWVDLVRDVASLTLFPQANSWYLGANIPGKPRYFSAYLGGSLYYMRLADVTAKGYEGFVFEKADSEEEAEAS